MCVCACMCVHVCVCVCARACVCIVWKVDLGYLTQFLQISCSTDCISLQKDFYTICATCCECVAVCLCVCSRVICEFLQGRCSRHVTCMGVRHLGGSDIAEWVITEYRLISFSATQPNQYAHLLFSSNLFTSFFSSTITGLCLLAAGCYSVDSTVHNLLIKSGCDLINENNNSPILGLLGYTEHIFVVWESFI